MSSSSFDNICSAFIASIIKKVSEDYSLKKKKRSKIKKIAPVHNHPICKTLVLDCPLCQSHGNVMSEIEYELKIKVDFEDV
jgi:hypothetical protein